MFSAKSFFIAVMGVFAVICSAYSTEPKPSVPASDTGSDLWIPVDDADWAVYMEAPQYHFALAKEYLQKGEYSKASSELKRGNSFLAFQAHRLSIASKQIETLAKGIVKGKKNDIARFDAVTSSVFKVIDNKYTMIPVEIRVKSIFEDAYKYHFDEALSKLRENDHVGAASEIRRAGSFIKLMAAHTGVSDKAEINEAVGEINEMASKVESGLINDPKELDRVFQKAIYVVYKKKK